MNNVSKPEISPAFTLEDIHKIREWHYEKRKGMTPEEIIKDTNKGAAEFEALLNEPLDPIIQAEINKMLCQTRETVII